MQDYQQRVVDEQSELHTKVGKLIDFTQGKVFPTLSEKEQTQLEAQLRHMMAYDEILLERIHGFN